MKAENNKEDKPMIEQIRYRILLHRLRAEIAETVRAANERDAAPHMLVSLQTGVKSTCKACESIV